MVFSLRQHIHAYLTTIMRRSILSVLVEERTELPVPRAAMVECVSVMR